MLFRRICSEGFNQQGRSLKKLFSNWSFERKVEIIESSKSYGRIVAKPLYSMNQLPLCRTASCDGVAVKASNFENITSFRGILMEGQDYQKVDTGHDFMDDFDAVIRIEEFHTLEGNQVKINFTEPLKSGDWTMKSGCAVEKGALIMDQGTRIRSEHLAILALAGLATLPVVKKPRVAFIPTGNELIKAFQTPKRGQMIDCNSLMVESMINNFGGECLLEPIVDDCWEALEKALEKSLEEADIVILNGGSSKGQKDYNTKLIKAKGKLLVHGVTIVPGKPFGIGIIKGKPVINLPGPTLAAYNGIKWCLQPMINHFLGAQPIRTVEEKVQLVSSLKPFNALNFLCKLKVWEENGILRGKPLDFREESTAKVLNAQGLYLTPIGGSPHPEGSLLPIEILER